MKSFLGVAGYLIFLVIVILIIGFGLHHLESILKVTATVAFWAFVLSILALIISLIPAARSFTGASMVILSYPLGLHVWLMGVAAVYFYWGLGALVVGLLFFWHRARPDGHRRVVIS
jgi:hypothetical protein